LTHFNEAVRGTLRIKDSAETLDAGDIRLVTRNSKEVRELHQYSQGASGGSRPVQATRLAEEREIEAAMRLRSLFYADACPDGIVCNDQSL